ncbi:MAG TPA: hypothetical protein VG962_05830 [Steroidobacteraceae bacterium]|nr:hypothetical protein [Steroidobacteraceae bacterium]
MKLYAKIIALCSWIVTGLIQVTYELQTPSKVVMQGVDITQSVSRGHSLAVIWIGLGLILASAAFIVKRASSVLIIISAFLYLTEWFPWASVRIVGLLETYRYKWILASGLEFEIVFLIRDILMPVAFLVTLILAIWSMIKEGT